MSKRIRYTRDELLEFRHLETTRNLPANLNQDLLNDLAEACFFDESAISSGLVGGVLGRGVIGGPIPGTGLGVPVRSRLVEDGGMDDSALTFSSQLVGNRNGSGYPMSSPQRIQRRPGDENRWDAHKSPNGSLEGSWKAKQQRGGARPEGRWTKTDDSFSQEKGSVSGSPSRPGHSASRWVRMEGEDSWRKKDGGSSTPASSRHGWHEGSGEGGNATPEWANVNPNLKIAMTAGQIEAERQRMQAMWRKDSKPKKDEDVEEIDEDEIERWKKEQDEEDRKKRDTQLRQPNPTIRDTSNIPLNQPPGPSSQPGVGIPAPQVPPMNAGSNLLAMLHAGPRGPANAPPREPPQSIGMPLNYRPVMQPPPGYIPQHMQRPVMVPGPGGPMMSPMHLPPATGGLPMQGVPPMQGGAPIMPGVHPVHGVQPMPLPGMQGYPQGRPVMQPVALPQAGQKVDVATLFGQRSAAPPSGPSLAQIVSGTPGQNQYQ
eukprot:jgi/Picsp_1/2327/NSC_05790-R1_---NA---